MKKTFLILLCTLSLFAVDGGKKPFDMPPPSIKAPCTGGNDSFAVYKDTKCDGSGLSLFKPRCLELILMSALGFVSNDEVKHYRGEEAIAYLKDKKCGQCPYETTVQDDIVLATMEAKKITLITKDNIQFNGTAYAPDMEKIYIFINQKCIKDKCEKVELVTSKKANVVTKSVNPTNNTIQDSEQYRQLLEAIQPKLILEKNSVLSLHKEIF